MAIQPARQIKLEKRIIINFNTNYHKCETWEFVK